MRYNIVYMFGADWEGRYFINRTSPDSELFDLLRRPDHRERFPLYVTSDLSQDHLPITKRLRRSGDIILEMRKGYHA